MPSLLRRLFAGKPNAEHLTVTVYTREQCCLCHKVIDLLKERQKRYGFRIVEVDIDDDPELAALYGEQIPVIAFNDKVRFRTFVNPALLDRLLLAEASTGR